MSVYSYAQTDTCTKLPAGFAFSYDFTNHNKSSICSLTVNNMLFFQTHFTPTENPVPGNTRPAPPDKLPLWDQCVPESGCLIGLRDGDGEAQRGGAGMSQFQERCRQDAGKAQIASPADHESQWNSRAQMRQVLGYSICRRVPPRTHKHTHVHRRTQCNHTVHGSEQVVTVWANIWQAILGGQGASQV